MEACHTSSKHFHSSQIYLKIIPNKLGITLYSIYSPTSNDINHTTYCTVNTEQCHDFFYHKQETIQYS